jgi:aminopeptidase YwaD
MIIQFKKLAFCCVIFLGFLPTLQSQKISPQLDHLLELVRTEYSGEAAFQTTQYVSERWRLPGNTGFNESIYQVQGVLEAAGFRAEGEGSSSPLTYRIEKYPLRQPAWEPVDASLRIIGELEPLLSFETNRNMIAINSFPTPEAGIVAEVIHMSGCDASQLADLDIKGKIVLADCHSFPLFQLAVKDKGAIGILSYRIPKYNQPEKHIHSIPFRSIPFNSEYKAWGINVSYHAYQKLLARLETGSLKVQVKIDTKIYPSEELAIIAEIRGQKEPGERLLFSAHVQEPGANDNASGVGALTEMARVAAELVKTGEVAPDRTITFLWGDEILATRRYIEQDSVRAKGIRWGISLDMVGEDTEKTGGTFLIEKMPDPSAIWTRGADQHTEWGASRVDKSQFNPHYFNDVITFICKKQGRATNWVVKTNPYEGGSDHVPFLRAGIPGLLLWHFTDVFYHTDQDRIDKVSPQTLANVGISALTSAFFLCTSSEQTAKDILRITQTAALNRIRAEDELSQQSLLNGGEKEKEAEIIQSWGDWYREALPSVRDVLLENASKKLERGLKKAVRKVDKEAELAMKRVEE